MKSRVSRYQGQTERSIIGANTLIVRYVETDQGISNGASAGMDSQHSNEKEARICVTALYGEHKLPP